MLAAALWNMYHDLPFEDRRRRRSSRQQRLDDYRTYIRRPGEPTDLDDYQHDQLDNRYRMYRRQVQSVALPAINRLRNQAVFGLNRARISRFGEVRYPPVISGQLRQVIGDRVMSYLR